MHGSLQALFQGHWKTFIHHVLNWHMLLLWKKNCFPNQFFQNRAVFLLCCILKEAFNSDLVLAIIKHFCPKITKRLWSYRSGLNLHRFNFFQLFVSFDRALYSNNINLFISFRNKANKFLGQTMKIIISSCYFHDKVNPFPANVPLLYPLKVGSTEVDYG